MRRPDAEPCHEAGADRPRQLRAVADKARARDHRHRRAAGCDAKNNGEREKAQIVLLEDTALKNA